MAAGLGPPQKARSFGASARRLLGRLGPERPLIVVVLLFAVGSVALTIAGPKILGDATDLIFAPVMAHRAVDFAALGRVLTLALVVYLGSSLFGWLQGHLLNDAVQRTVKRLRTAVEDKLMRVPLSYFDGRPHGEILSRVTNDIDNIQMGLQQTLTQILNSLLLVVGILIMFFVISPLLAVIALVTVGASVVTTARIGKRAQQSFAAQWRHVGALNGQIEEAFTGHALVKVFGRRAEVERRFRAKNDELHDAAFHAQFVSSTIMPAIGFIGNLNYVAIAVVGGLRVADHALLLGSLQAFIQYSRRFTQSLSQLASVSAVLQSGVASAERVFELLDTPDQSPDRDDAAVPATVRGEIRFDDVSFRYAPESPLIEHLSLVVEPGQTVAIVGPTGAGKTTLVNLLMRFYDLDGGRILLDGVDTATVPRAALRARFGMVLQDTWLFGGTIRDNIRYGKPTATDDELLAAARATYVDRFVRALPDGYDTVIDEDSRNLSVGEQQLVTIARAFLADPAILILDEATSSVDTRTEVQVQQAMATLRARRTSFVIAHRLSTIRDADVILVMERGAIVEHGVHDELLAAGGPYHDLYHAQFAAPAAG
ncbi:MAG: ABC transporter ATP-binding protein [Kofleriaceae bacterium]|nr:ABC transporter ATP-binding protein [Myxococcales bacterium]MCB9570980.1 ABC transporter ATP-binding protein [Kofleriaceae bacterium]